MYVRLRDYVYEWAHYLDKPCCRQLQMVWILVHVYQNMPKYGSGFFWNQRYHGNKPEKRWTTSKKKLRTGTKLESTLIKFWIYPAMAQQPSGGTEKIDTFVDFPMDLDLDPFVVGPKATTRQLYRLYAVVNHSGSLSFGHYTAWPRKNQRWA